MATIRALKTHPKGGKFRQVGEIYDAPDKFASLMVMIGKAEYIYDDEALVAPELVGTGKNGRILKKDREAYETALDEYRAKLQNKESVVEQEAEKDAETDEKDESSLVGGDKILTRDTEGYNTRMLKAE